MEEEQLAPEEIEFLDRARSNGDEALLAALYGVLTNHKYRDTAVGGVKLLYAELGVGIADAQKFFGKLDFAFQQLKDSAPGIEIAGALRKRLRDDA